MKTWEWIVACFTGLAMGLLLYWMQGGSFNIPENVNVFESENQ